MVEITLKRILVYGDSNSWGTPPDGSGIRFDQLTRWPCVLARKLNATLIEAALPGRTTVHDDPEMLGAIMNGLEHMPGTLLSHSPIDLVLIMLGTNDFKARFSPDAAKIANNIGQLIECIEQIGGGPGPWQEGEVPAIAILVPPELSEQMDRQDYGRQAEWAGGRQASLGLANAITEMAKPWNIPVFDTSAVIKASDTDPIHLTADSHIVLGRAVADWLVKLNGQGNIPKFDAD